MKSVNLHALEKVPLIIEGDNIGKIICKTAKDERFGFENGDIVVIASKIVSKAEGRLIDTEKIKPSKKALMLSKKVGINPKNLEVILNQTKKLLIAKRDLILTQDKHGFINTKSGVDTSNTAVGPKGKIVAVLPKNPDFSARKIRKEIEKTTGKKLAVIINDTFGRSNRKGSVGMAIGISGLPALHIPEIKEDLFGHQRHPEIALVDEISSAASLLMGQTNEKRPIVIVRGVNFKKSEGKIKDLLHPVTKVIQDANEITNKLKYLK